MTEDLHAEVAALREEIAELRKILVALTTSPKPVLRKGPVEIVPLPFVTSRNAKGDPLCDTL